MSLGLGTRRRLALAGAPRLAHLGPSPLDRVVRWCKRVRARLTRWRLEVFVLAVCLIALLVALSGCAMRIKVEATGAVAKAYPTETPTPRPVPAEGETR